MAHREEVNQKEVAVSGWSMTRVLYATHQIFVKFMVKRCGCFKGDRKPPSLINFNPTLTIWSSTKIEAKEMVS
jgi:hypothetical protein